MSARLAPSTAPACRALVTSSVADFRDGRHRDVAVRRRHLDDAARQHLGETVGERLLVGPVRDRLGRQDGEVDRGGQARRVRGADRPPPGGDEPDQHGGDQGQHRARSLQGARDRAEAERPGDRGVGPEDAVERVAQRRRRRRSGRRGLWRGTASTTASSAGGTSARVLGGGGSSCEHGVDHGRAERARKGRRPVSISYRTTPSDHTSERASTRPRDCSGAPYSSVPAVSPVFVSGHVGHLGDAEVEHLGRPVLAHEHVGRLEVAVDDAPRVGRGDARRDAARRGGPPRDRERHRAGAARPASRRRSTRGRCRAGRRRSRPPRRRCRRWGGRAWPPRGPRPAGAPWRPGRRASAAGKNLSATGRPSRVSSGPVDDAHPAPAQLPQEPVRSRRSSGDGGGRRWEPSALIGQVSRSHQTYS